MDPSFHLIAALFHDRKSGAPRAESSDSLLRLAGHPNEDVQLAAFQALFSDPDPHVNWVAARLAFDLAHYIHPIRNEKTFELDHTTDREARKAALAKALHALAVEANKRDFELLPAAWVKSSGRQRGDGDYWTDPERSFDGQRAAKLFAHFPLEKWCQSDVYRPLIETLLVDLARWTAERLMPTWNNNKRKNKQTDLYEWDRALGTIFARILPFFDLHWLRENFVKPFSADDEEALRVLAEFADGVVRRHVLDAKDIPTNALPVLDDCVQRAIDDQTFKPNGYRAGEVHGYDMPCLIKALLFVNVEQECSGAARFVNGDWSAVVIVMPIVTKLMQTAGWSTFIMQNFLNLCDRAASSYPIDAFIEQATVALEAVEYARGSWVGTSLPARLAAVIQRLADNNYPLQVSRARGLLKLLDILIDLGDRRSAALEQDEAFRRVQGLVA